MYFKWLAHCTMLMESFMLLLFFQNFVCVTSLYKSKTDTSIFDAYRITFQDFFFPNLFFMPNWENWPFSSTVQTLSGSVLIFTLVLVQSKKRALYNKDWHHVSIIPLSVFMPIKLSVCSRSKSRNLQRNVKEMVNFHFVLSLRRWVLKHLL